MRCEWIKAKTKGGISRGKNNAFDLVLIE